MTEITEPGRILPCLQPPGWSDANTVLCEPLVGAAPLWNGAIPLPLVAYGVDRADAFEFFAPDASRLVELRAVARATLTGLSFELDLLDYETFRVLDVHGSYFASESILDPARMRDFQTRLGTDMLAVGIPCRGHAYVTAGTQDETSLRRFVDLIALQYESAGQPLFSLPVIVQDGEVIGLLRLADDGEFEDGDEVRL